MTCTCENCNDEGMISYDHDDLGAVEQYCDCEIGEALQYEAAKTDPWLARYLGDEDARRMIRGGGR